MRQTAKRFYTSKILSCLVLAGILTLSLQGLPLTATANESGDPSHLAQAEGGFQGSGGFGGGQFRQRMNDRRQQGGFRGGPNGGGPNEGQPRQMPDDMKKRIEEKMAEQGITKEQMEQMKQSHEQNRQRAQALRQQIMQKQRSLMEYIKSPNATESQALTMHQEIVRMQGQIQEMRIRSAFQMRETLGPEKFQKFAEQRQGAFNKMRDRIQQGGDNGSGGFRGRPQQGGGNRPGSGGGFRGQRGQ